MITHPKAMAFLCRATCTAMWPNKETRRKIHKIMLGAEFTIARKYLERRARKLLSVWKFDFLQLTGIEDVGISCRPK